MRKLLVAIFCVLIASSAFAGTITSLDPSSVRINSGEYFLTVYGTAPGNTLVFDGPAGHFERTVNATFSNRVVGWVPEAIVQKSGTYTVKVRNSSGVETNSLNFTVVGFKFFPLVMMVPDVLLAQPKTREGVSVKFDVMPVGGEDPNPQFRCDRDSGAFFPMGFSVVTCNAWNSLGEKAEAKFTINVVDQVGPVVTVPRDVKVPARSNEGAKVEFTAKATDEIWGDSPVDCLPRSGSMFRIGKTAVLCTSTDLELNIGASSFIVEVTSDKEPRPITLLLPPTMNVEARDARGSEVKYDLKVEGSDDPDPSIVCNPKSGSLFPLGTTTVVCDALDKNGAWAVGQFDVSVLDVKAPEIRYAKASPDRISNDDRMTTVEISAEAIDDLDLQPLCSIIGVTANEDIDAGDDEKAEYDYNITGPLKVELRGQSTRTTRVYNVWVGCSDFFGNMTQANAQVVVTNSASGQAAPSGRRRAGGKP
ncbi:MAG TPA: hypothetical protein VGQ76_03170 [Thermoanaerobaculia bacterium]|jgi:hypothetical protein|nr:hypothetical protein [Thermoanaerobaculia bacterium]